MLALVSALPRVAYAPLVFALADTDDTSERRVVAANVAPPGAAFVRIPRSREVGQSYATAVASTARAIVASVSLVARERPGLVLLNGPGTCLPVALAARALAALCLVPPLRIVFVESVCRTRSLSLTGRLLLQLHVADQVQVQWPALKER